MEEILKKYERKLENGVDMSMEISIKGECHNEKELLETLSFIAISAHQFYLDVAQEIKNRLS